uniref:TMC domain-containing protein n=1 Tax=Rhabditophanes sp. KR3021 TaxID=114890 RepID=A0AC35UG19_9BILA
MFKKLKSMFGTSPTHSNDYEAVINEAGEHMMKEYEMTEPRKSVASDVGGSNYITASGIESSEEEASASRLARRSSVLADLFSLFRRPSGGAFKGHRGRYPSSGGPDSGEIEDTEDEDPKNMSKERLMNTIRQKKEIIGNVRCKAWNMERKRRTLKVVRHHLQRQEAEISRVKLYKVEAARVFHIVLRWFGNIKIYLIPWENKIKNIESHFGSVVSSYFTFLRWVLGVNITLSLIIMLFVSIPEWLADNRNDLVRYNRTQAIKVMPEQLRLKADELTTIYDFRGYLEYSLLFYGYYSSETYFGDTIHYRVPLAYFLVNLAVLAFSFFIILSKMADNARNSKMSGSKTEQYVFSWKAFTGWDCSIGNSETSSSLYMANVIKFRETIAEYNVKIKKKFVWLEAAGRLLANLIIGAMLVSSAWAIHTVSKITNKDSFIKQNAVSITVSFITLIFPNIFELIGKLEKYHPRTALRFQLGRVMILYAVNYYTLIVTLLFMLKDWEEKGNQDGNNYYENGVQTIPLAQTSNSSDYYQVYNRAARQLVNYSTTPSPLSTLAPPSVWTTVFSNYGPIGVSNPKAIVSPKFSTSYNTNDKIVYESRPIGPKTWSDANKTIETVVLNFTTSSGRPVTSTHFGQRHDDLCWENLLGQEIMKIVTMDLLMTVAAILVVDFFRACVHGLRSANTDLSDQLMRERTEEKKKIFELAGGRKRRHTKKESKKKMKARLRENEKKNGPQRKNTHVSSDEESYIKSTSSRAAVHNKHFVPSLGSVNEDDGELDEVKQRLLQEHDILDEFGNIKSGKVRRREFTLKEKFLICMGIVDPKKIREKEQQEIDEAEENYKSLFEGSTINRRRNSRSNTKDVNLENIQAERKDALGDSPTRKSDITEYQFHEIQNEEEPVERKSELGGHILVDYASPSNSYYQAMNKMEEEQIKDSKYNLDNQGYRHDDRQHSLTGHYGALVKKKKRSPKLVKDTVKNQRSIEDGNYSDDEESSRHHLIQMESHTNYTEYNNNKKEGTDTNEGEEETSSDEIDHPLKRKCSVAEDVRKHSVSPAKKPLQSPQQDRSFDIPKHMSLSHTSQSPTIIENPFIKLSPYINPSLLHDSYNSPQQLQQPGSSTMMYSSSSSGSQPINSYTAAMKSPVREIIKLSEGSNSGDDWPKIRNIDRGKIHSASPMMYRPEKHGYVNPLTRVEPSSPKKQYVIEGHRYNAPPSTSLTQAIINREGDPNRGRTSSPDKTSYAPRFRISASPPRRAAPRHRSPNRTSGSPRKYTMRVEGILTSDSEHEPSPTRIYRPSTSRQNSTTNLTLKGGKVSAEKRSRTNERSPSCSHQQTAV